jgi:acyl-CoA reductase-like NAD-dependent aldehyde dehydrogenase
LNKNLSSMNTLTITNPATGQTITTLSADDADSVAAKAARARAAQSAWAQVPLAQRKTCIEGFRAGIVRDLESLARTMSTETGKPIRQARNELNGLLGRIDFFVQQVQPSVASETVFDEGGMKEQIEHIPLGVIGNISAWNYPWFVGGNVFVPALLTGNAVLYKPSEFASMSGLEMARLLHEAGVPQDVFIPLIGGGEVGAALLAQKIDGLFFTGSYPTGERIARVLGPRMVKLQLELGGKDPTYVCEDADPKTAAESLADGAMYNTGQSCCSVERIYVHERIHDAFVAAFMDTVRGFKAGDPLAEDTYIGAITRAPQLDVLDAQVADAKAAGARLMCGGHRLEGPGNWYAPTVFTEVNHSMELMREESFGPIIGIQKVSGDAEALRLMNDTRYGLTAGVFTPDAERARTLLAQVNAGSVYWNCCDRVSPRLPWSGHGDSGIGLTLSTHGIQTFTRTKAWHLRQA